MEIDFIWLALSPNGSDLFLNSLNGLNVLNRLNRRSKRPDFRSATRVRKHRLDFLRGL